MSKLRLAARVVGVCGLALMLGSPAFAAPVVQNGPYYQSSQTSTIGTVTSVIRQGDIYRVRLNDGTYDYWVPVSMVGSRVLRPGETVRLNGNLNGDVVNVDLLAFPGEPYYSSEENPNALPYATVPYGQTGWMSGTVQRTDRHLGYLVIREDTSGRMVKIDVRHMNTHRPVYIWDLRPGDQMSVRGRWEAPGLFDAMRVQF